MSRIATEPRQAVEPEKRRAFRAVDVAAARERQHGRCFDCPAPLAQGFEADHDLPRGLLGKTDLANLRLRCSACHLKKTTERDRPMIDKAKRQAKMGDPKPPSRFRSPGFRTDLRRRMNGTVEART